MSRDPIAAIVGSSSFRMFSDILSGSVRIVNPLTRDVCTTSSNERMKANRAPPMMPGRMSGIVTRTNVWIGLACMLSAARSRRRSKVASVADTMTTPSKMGRQERSGTIEETKSTAETPDTLRR